MEMNDLDLIWWDIFEQFDDFYCDMAIIIWAIKMDTISTLLEPTPIVFDPLENTENTMPAYHSPLLSPFSSSSDTSQQPALTGSPNISFLDYLKLFNDSFTALTVALFKQQELMVKTNEMKHLAELVERLQDEVNWQQEYLEEIFNGMEAMGLHQILKKHFVRDNGVIRTR